MNLPQKTLSGSNLAAHTASQMRHPKYGSYTSKNQSRITLKSGRRKLVRAKLFWTFSLKILLPQVVIISILFVKFIIDIISFVFIK